MPEPISPACFLQTLQLKHFRCFSSFEIEFHPRLTVLSALNGQGKTALLDAIAIALEPFVAVMEARPRPKGFARNDIHRVMRSNGTMDILPPVRLEAKGLFFGETVAWARQMSSMASHSRTTTKEAAALQKLAKQYQDAQAKEAAPTKQHKEADRWPLLSYYGTGRLWGTTRSKQKKRKSLLAPNARRKGYQDCLSPSPQYKSFVEWFRRFSYEEKQEQTKPSPHRPSVVLRCVRDAVEKALGPSGVSELAWDFAEDTIVALHREHGRLPVEMMSDGIRTMIGLVADLARRCVLLNPHLAQDAAQQSPGIVLIDEVDLHLHPAWQQVVLSSLSEAFPCVQFIVTTHSPQVLSTVKAESIRIISSGQESIATTPFEQTRGVESAYVLERVMGVAAVPAVEEAKELQRYRSFIETGRASSEEARLLRNKLEEHFGTNHPNILECDRLIRFQALKQKHVQRG